MIPVAVVQAAPVAFDLSSTLDRTTKLCREAAASGAKLVVFPEAFIGGYPKGMDFGVEVGRRSDEGRAWFQRYYEGALEVPGPDFKRLEDLAGELGITLVIGAIEKSGGTLYCTALTLGPNGLLNKHRKTMPTAMERVIWGCGDGQSVRVVDTEVGPLSTAICWENYMPPLRQRLYEGGTTLYCAPTVDDREIWATSMRHIAYEGRCFVLGAAQFATRADFPDDYECSFGNDPGTVLINGGSCIVDPFGKLVVEPVYGQSTILMAELDPDLIVRGKFDLDVAGHYSRPEIFESWWR